MASLRNQIISRTREDARAYLVFLTQIWMRNFHPNSVILSPIFEAIV